MSSSNVPAPRQESLRIGVIGAGRVGAVLAAALRSAGHEIVAAAGESDASRGRIAALLPGVPTEKPSAVARACDLLLLTVPDDMLPNVVAMLAASGAIHEGQYVVHTSGRHGLGGARAGRRGRRPPGGAAPRADVHRHRRRPAPAARAASTASPPATPSVPSPSSLVADLGGRPVWVPEEQASALPRGARPRRQPPGHARDARRWSCSPRPASTSPPTRCGRCSQAALDNALEQGDSALTGPIVRGDVETVRDHLAEVRRNAPDTLPSYVAMARATLDRVVTDGRVLPIRAVKIRQAARRGGRPDPDAHRRMTRPSVASTRAELADLLAAARRGDGRIALVPTMGALHEGHASLMARARAEVGPGGRVVTSIFVNPLQFGPGEDLDRYPRSFDADLKLCEREGVDVVFAPGLDEVYPGGVSTGSPTWE